MDKGLSPALLLISIYKLAQFRMVIKSFYIRILSGFTKSGQVVQPHILPLNLQLKNRTAEIGKHSSFSEKH